MGRPKAPRAPRARQQWELYSFRGKDGKRWTLQRRVPRERDDTPPNTPLREDSSETRRAAHQPRPDGHTHRGRCSLNLRTMRTIRLAWAVSRQTLRAARVNELLNKLDVLYVTYGNIYFN